MPTTPGLTLTLDAARALDAAATERFGIPGLLLMEHAAIGVAAVVEIECRRSGRDRVLVACGGGGNGGDGWAVARLLANRGVEVLVASIGPTRPGSDAAVNEEITRRLARIPGSPLEIRDALDADGIATLARDASDRVVVDALFGVGLARPIDGIARGIIDAITAAAATVVAVDLPSGLDANSGRPLGPCMRADVTATMVAPKTGLLAPDAASWSGRIEIVDIGTPPALLREFGRMAETAPVGDDASIPSAESPR